MGRAKRELERQEELCAQAALVAVQAGAMRECEVHERVYIESGDVESAYRLGNHLFTTGDVLVQEFDSRREMTDSIKSVMDAAASTCPLCQKIFEDD